MNTNKTVIRETAEVAALKEFFEKISSTTLIQYERKHLKGKTATELFSDFDDASIKYERLKAISRWITRIAIALSGLTFVSGARVWFYNDALTFKFFVGEAVGLMLLMVAILVINEKAMRALERKSKCKGDLEFLRYLIQRGS